MLCCQEFEVKDYDFTLGRLACESLRPVQVIGMKLRIATLCLGEVRRAKTEVALYKSLEHDFIIGYFPERILSTMRFRKHLLVIFFQKCVSLFHDF